MLNNASVTPTVAGSSLTVTVTDGSSHNGSATITTVNPGTAAKLVFTTSPSGATAGSAFTGQPVVQTEDTYGNLSTVGLGSSVTVTIAIKTGTGTLQGTTSYDIGTGGGHGNGTITGSGLRIDQATSFTLKATGSLTEGDSGSFTVSPASANAYVIAANTTTPTAGVSDQLTIKLVDQFGNTVTSFGGDKNLTFSGLSTADNGTHPTVTSKTPSAVNLGTAELVTFTAGSSTAGGSLVGYKAETQTLNVHDDAGTPLSSTSTGGAGVSLTIANVNPVAGADTFARGPGQSLKMAVTAILANDTDANQDIISLSSVDTPSTGGATLLLSGANVFYTPNSAGNGDTFSYHISDGHSGTATGTVTGERGPGREHCAECHGFRGNGDDQLLWRPRRPI